nr:MAG TPA: hypothetical protein [Caudoviricetes sp.]
MKTINICDILVPYFSGIEPLNDALDKASKLFLKTFEDETFICKGCGEIIFPKVTFNEHGIFIESSRAEIRGGKGNHCIERDVCEECVKKVNVIRW